MFPAGILVYPNSAIGSAMDTDTLDNLRTVLARRLTLAERDQHEERARRVVREEVPQGVQIRPETRTHSTQLRHQRDYQDVVMPNRDRGPMRQISRCC